MAVQGLRESLSFDKGWGDGRDSLTCPLCGDTYTHVVDARSIPYDRGGMFAVAIESECGHAFDVVFQTHKGEGTVWIDNVRTYEQRPK